MKKIFTVILSLLVFCTVGINAQALDHGAYGVSVETNYWNPDTNEIDDGGTANAALGDGMSRSCTGTTALVEKDGDKYYVTIRLLLQSSTNDAKFWQRTGFNTYSAIKYEIIAENAVADSVDYRFEVANPFTPIKVSMYVVPMGRDVIWFLELNESTISSNTGDFIVSVKEVVQEEATEPEILETVEPEISTEDLEEEKIDKSEDLTENDENEEILTSDEIVEELLLGEDLEENLLLGEELDEELDENLLLDESLDEDVLDDVILDSEPTLKQDEVLDAEPEILANDEVLNETKTYTVYIVLAVVVAVACGGFYYFKNKRGK